MQSTNKATLTADPDFFDRYGYPQRLEVILATRDIVSADPQPDSWYFLFAHDAETTFYQLGSDALTYRQIRTAPETFRIGDHEYRLIEDDIWNIDEKRRIKLLSYERA